MRSFPAQVEAVEQRAVEGSGRARSVGGEDERRAGRPVEGTERELGPGAVAARRANGQQPVAGGDVEGIGHRLIADQLGAEGEADAPAAGDDGWAQLSGEPANPAAP